MLPRILLALVLFVGGLFAYGKLRTPPLLRVPRRWRNLAKIPSSVFGRALAHRQGMASLLLEGKAQHTSLLLDEVDTVLAGMVELHDQRALLAKVARKLSGKAALTAATQISRIEQDLKESAEWLDEAHNHLLGVAAGEYTDTITQLRSKLQNRSTGFQATLSTYKDLERQLGLQEGDIS